jgi:hypothetical protein
MSGALEGVKQPFNFVRLWKRWEREVALNANGYFQRCSYLRQGFARLLCRFIGIILRCEQKIS